MQDTPKTKQELEEHRQAWIDLGRGVVGTMKKGAPNPPLPKGRPSKYTPEVVTKLLAAYRMGFNDMEAAAYADISRKTLWDWLYVKPDFRNKIYRAKSTPNMKAKEVVINAINNNDLRASQWWLEHKAADEFSKKPSDGPAIPGELKEIADSSKHLIELNQETVCTLYRFAIFRLREQERAAYMNARNNNKPSLRDTMFTELLELPDHELINHITQEIRSTGKDIASVDILLLIRECSLNDYKEILEIAQKWTD